MPAKLLYPWLTGAYVYAIKVDGVVRYIGKGRRYRMIEHRRIAQEINRRRVAGEKVRASHFHNRLAKALRNGCVLEHIVIAHALTDDVAYDLERKTIATAPVGELWNVKAGGPEGDSRVLKALWSDPKERERLSRAIRNGKRKQEFREKARQTAIAQWADPEKKARWTKSHRAIWDDEHRAAERRALLKRVWADPEKSARKSALVKSQWTPERRAAMAENRRRAWANPEFKKRVSKSISRSRTPEMRARLAAAARGRWQDEDFRTKTTEAIKASQNARSKNGMLLRSARAQKV